MKQATVLAADPVSRLCNLKSGTKTYTSIIIPYNLNFLRKEYRVLFDEDENVVIAVIGIPDQITQDPLGGSSKDIPTSSDFIQSQHIVEGDYFNNLPEAGYVGLLRGFVAMIGSSPLSQMMFMGTKKLARIVAANLDIEGGENFFIRIHTNDGKLPPSVEIKLGAIVITSDTKTEIKTSMANTFEILFRRESYSIKLFNPTTAQMETITEADYSNPSGEYKNPDWNPSGDVDGPTEKVGRELYFTLTQKLFVELADVVLKVKKAQLSAEKFIVVADQLSLNGKNSLSVSGKVVDLKADAGMNISGGNVKVTVAPGGTFVVGTSANGGIKVDPTRIQITSGATGIELNGTGDVMVNGTILVNLLTTLLSLMGNMAGLIPLGPAAGPGLAPIVAGLATISSTLPLLINPMIRHGKGPLPALS